MNAEQRHACGRELDRKRDAVQSPTYRDYLVDVVVPKSKLVVDRVRAFHEQRHGAELSRILELRTRRYRERAESINMFVAALERFLRGDEDAHVRRPRAQKVDQPNDV